MDIYNELDRHEISATFILVGQRELVHQRQAFEKAKQMQIVGRFMVHLHQFAGLRDLDDCRFCLEQYDQGCEYPDASGWSFTRYYFPIGFEAGWRLAHEAKELWEAFKLVRAEAKLPGKLEIPMQYFSRTVECAMKTFTSADCSRPTIGVDQWKDAIELSGYRDAGRYL